MSPGSFFKFCRATFIEANTSYDFDANAPWHAVWVNLHLCFALPSTLEAGIVYVDCMGTASSVHALYIIWIFWSRKNASLSCGLFHWQRRQLARISRSSKGISYSTTEVYKNYFFMYLKHVNWICWRKYLNLKKKYLISGFLGFTSIS